ncbi:MULTISPECIES: putative holin-like toxin [Loigolactobacillus]|nr:MULTISPECIES: putative holin-like toxin [Loigolactobacillus]MDA5387345.1 putative holin-like toxin [Loigolactobacillus backii]MDA5389884.1 putative holin-like toxin [Loigolactobacillus backii]
MAALTLMLGFGMFVISLISLVIAIVKLLNDNKK